MINLHDKVHATSDLLVLINVLAGDGIPARCRAERHRHQRGRACLAGHAHVDRADDVGLSQCHRAVGRSAACRAARRELPGHDLRHVRICAAQQRHLSKRLPVRREVSLSVGADGRHLVRGGRRCRLLHRRAAGVFRAGHGDLCVHDRARVLDRDRAGARYFRRGFRPDRNQGHLSAIAGAGLVRDLFRLSRAVRPKPQRNPVRCRLARPAVAAGKLADLRDGPASVRRDAGPDGNGGRRIGAAAAPVHRKRRTVSRHRPCLPHARHQPAHAAPQARHRGHVLQGADERDAGAAGQEVSARDRADRRRDRQPAGLQRCLEFPPRVPAADRDDADRLSDSARSAAPKIRTTAKPARCRRSARPNRR